VHCKARNVRYIKIWNGGFYFIRRDVLASVARMSVSLVEINMVVRANRNCNFSAVRDCDSRRELELLPRIMGFELPFSKFVRIQPFGRLDQRRVLLGGRWRVAEL